MFHVLTEAYLPSAVRVTTRDGGIRRVSGRVFVDFVGRNDSLGFLISRRMRNTLNAFTGFDARRSVEISVQSVGKETYFQFEVTGRSGPIVNLDSHVVDRDVDFVHAVGMRIDRSGWDGSDLFHPFGSSTIVCSPSVVEALRESNISNIELTPLDSVERWVPAEEW